MILLPAVDILEGRAVRLARGDYEQRTVYDEPLAAARRWVQAGARALHVVDLDGARRGRPVNLEHVRAIAAELDVPVQVGGGLRDAAAVEAVLQAGADRVVLGTSAMRDPDLLDEVLARHRDRLVVSLDARGGRLAADGWREQTAIPITAAIGNLTRRGVDRFVYSSIDRDGMMEGPDLDEVVEVAHAVRGSFIYSGGISSLDDLRALAGLHEDKLHGVIVGRALYEGRLELAEAQATLDGR